MEKQNYIMPDIDVIEVTIEQGFAQSDTLEDINRKDPMGWGSL